MIGIIINVLSVAVGGLIGSVFGKMLSQDFSAKLTSVFGVCAMGMGISSITLMQNMPPVILAIVCGSALGLALRFGDKISKGAVLIQKPMAKLCGLDEQGTDTALFVTALVLFCASGTGIYGSLDAGMTGNVAILLSKSILDLFTAMVFACTLGVSVCVIAIPQALIFVMLFFMARVIFPLTTPSMIADFKACGGFLLIATGLRMAKIKDFPVADMIPAMVLAMPLSYAWTAWIAPLLA